MIHEFGRKICLQNSSVPQLIRGILPVQLSQIVRWIVSQNIYQHCQLKTKGNFEGILKLTPSLNIMVGKLMWWIYVQSQEEVLIYYQIDTL